MHNIKDLRKNLESFYKKFKNRNLNFDVEKFNKLDVLNRKLINDKELLEQEKNHYLNQKINQILINQKKFLKKFLYFQKNKMNAKEI